MIKQKIRQASHAYKSITVKTQTTCCYIAVEIKPTGNVPLYLLVQEEVLALAAGDIFQTQF